MGGFCKCNVPDFSRLMEKPSTLVKSKEIGFFKVLFPSSPKQDITDSSRLIVIANQINT